MPSSGRFLERYRTNDIPWDLGRPDANLIETVRTWPIDPCRAMDVGCGTGDNVIWLAERGFKVTGIDISEIAIERAKEKAQNADVKCVLAVTDFLKWKICSDEFMFVFDRGCFHTLAEKRERKRFAKNIHSCMAAGVIWLSIIGNADKQREETGPPRRTAVEITEAVEPCFEVLSLKSGHFDSKRDDPARAWIGVFRKRA
jgi:SAM-dependent methyltransferase